MKKTLPIIALAGALAAHTAAAQDKLTISVYSFAQDAYKELLYEPFQELCGCELVIETGNSIERMAKIEANAADPVIDLAVISSHDALSLARKGLLSPLDTSRISSFDKLYPAAQDPLGDNMGVGYTFYATSIVYRSDLVDIKSWGDLLGPDLAGNVSLPNIVGTQGPLALMMLDKSMGGSGDFSNVNGGFRANIARLSLDGVLDTSWTPNVTNGFSSGRAAPVQAITISPLGDVVYVGGNFAQIEGTPVAVTAAGRDISLLPLSALDGSVLPERFIPFITIDREAMVHDIAVTDDYVIITWGGPNFLTFHQHDGVRLQQYRGTGDIQALEVVGNNVLVGHHGEFFGFLPNPIPLDALTDDPEVFVPHRLHVFRLDTPDFAPGQAFTTTSPFGIWGIAAAEDSIWVAGQIETAGTNQHPVDGLARFPALD